MFGGEKNGSRQLEPLTKCAYVYEDRSTVHILQSVQCIMLNLIKQSYRSTFSKDITKDLFNCGIKIRSITVVS